MFKKLGITQTNELRRTALSKRRKERLRLTLSSRCQLRFPKFNGQQQYLRNILMTILLPCTVRLGNWYTGF